MRAFALRAAALGCMAATLVVSGMACTGVIGDANTSGSGGTAGNTGTTGTGSTSGTGTGGSATGTGSTTGTGGGGTGTGATTGNGFAAACAASKGVLNAGLIVAFNSDAPIALVPEDFAPAKLLGLVAFAGLVFSLYRWMLQRAARR